MTYVLRMIHKLYLFSSSIGEDDVAEYWTGLYPREREKERKKKNVINEIWKCRTRQSEITSHKAKSIRSTLLDGFMYLLVSEMYKVVKTIVR